MKKCHVKHKTHVLDVLNSSQNCPLALFLTFPHKLRPSQGTKQNSKNDMSSTLNYIEDNFMLCQ